MAQRVRDETGSPGFAMNGARARLDRKNKLFAALLAGVGLAIFVVVIVLVLALHYADVQLPGF
jgi:hypothetical protein